jgi:hypothetical protein
MNVNRVLGVLAIVAVAFAIFNVSIVFLRDTGGGTLTGNVAGYVNVTVNTQITLNFTTATVNWGAGVITSPNTNATLYTNNDSAASVSRGNWSTAPTALVLANIGNVNASVTLQTGATAATFLGGTYSQYMWNVTNKEAGSCTNNTEPLNAWANVNQTAAGKFCSQFGYATVGNEIYVNLLLTVSYDGLTGLRSDTITATASTAGT